ncbi:hypothetical protein CISIN_1g048635mg [Citrus sinensis]|uniref:Leucine-rich repeat-containing N-terminal plant-type domain-containing protein n=1 Tax=Citrus sinensis TaxID=2711 RepID=A0A067DAE7_CITSI|nr:hypothetical protein CISIN_1g048635mg [Citrus sinensis]
MKNSFIFDVDSTPPAKMSQWSDSTNCCDWTGVDCDEAGHVIGLDLSAEPILIGRLENASGLFSLQYMQSQFGLANLTNLTYLNLSHCGFTGEIPTEISSLPRLVTLDLSSREPISGFSWRLGIPNFNFFQNLKELRELYLDNVDLSGLGTERCKALSFLPNLQVLNLSSCLLLGPINHHLANLRSHSQFFFVANLLNLTNLDLSQCDLRGKYPEKILQVSTLETLDLSYNPLLQGSLPNFPKNSYLQNLNLANTSFSGILPDPIGILKYLTRVDLRSCSFTGPIPTSTTNLTQLFHVDFSSNHFSGPIPSFHESRNLNYLDLSSNNLNGVLNLGRNNLNGTLSDIIFPRNCGLHILDLSGNQLQGVVPKSLANCNMLQVLDFRNNHISDNFPCWLRNASSLQVLVLRSNNFSGHISYPRNNVSWPLLQIVDFASNKFGGRLSQKCSTTLGMRYQATNKRCRDQATEEMGRFKSLYALNMSHNALTGSIPSSFGNLKQIESLDLSMNNLSGKIPAQLASLNFLSVLNLSYNNLVGQIPTAKHVLPNFNLHRRQLQAMKLIGSS